jgi:hypothetical protein
MVIDPHEVVATSFVPRPNVARARIAGTVDPARENSMFENA